MKKTLICVATILLLAGAASIAKKRSTRDWKEGILKETAMASENLGAMAQAVPGMAVARNLTRTWQGFRVQASDLEYLLACPIRRGHMPNVTVNGKVHFSIERGKFYLLDDDGREFEMVVLQKAIQPGASTAPPPK